MAQRALGADAAPFFESCSRETTNGHEINGVSHHQCVYWVGTCSSAYISDAQNSSFLLRAFTYKQRMHTHSCAYYTRSLTQAQADAHARSYAHIHTHAHPHTDAHTHTHTHTYNLARNHRRKRTKSYPLARVCGYSVRKVFLLSKDVQKFTHYHKSDTCDVYLWKLIFFQVVFNNHLFVRTDISSSRPRPARRAGSKRCPFLCNGKKKPSTPPLIFYSHSLFSILNKCAHMCIMLLCLS